MAANLGKVRIAFLALTAAMAANPITLALLGIGAVAGAIIANPKDKYASLREQLEATNRLLDDGNLAEERRTRLLLRRVQLEGELAKLLNSNAGGGRGSVNLDHPEVPSIAAQVAAWTNKPAGSGGNGKPGKALAVTNQLSDAARDYARIMETFTASTAAAEAETLGLTRTQAKLREVMADPTWQSFSRQMQEQIIYKASLAEAAEELRDTTVKQRAAEKEAEENQARYNATLADTVQAALQEAEAAEEKLRTYGMLESQVQELTLAKLQEQLATRELTAEELKSIELRIAAQKRVIEARKGIEARVASDKAKDVAEQAAKQSEDVWRRTSERIGDTLTDALMRGFESGKSLMKNLRDATVNMFKSMVLRPAIQAVLMPTAGGLASLFPGTASAASGGLGGIGNLASLGGLFGGFGSGFSSGLTAWGAGGSVTGLLSSGSSLFAGGLANGLGTIAGALGPIALGALAISSLFRGRGETRSGGQYAGTTFLEGPSGGEINGQATRQAIETTQGTINGLLRQLGSDLQVSTLYSGLETSSKGRGFAYAGAQLSDGTFVGQDQQAGRNNRRGSKTPEQASAEFAEELKQVTIQTLQAADVPGQLGEYLRSLGDIDALTGGTLDAVFQRINKALTERQALEDRLFDLTASEADKLTRARERERDAIDATNHALLAQVHAQEDLRTAAEHARQVAEERRTLEDRLFDLTASETDKIALARQREREAIDATNLSLLAQVHAQEDLRTASQLAADQARAMRDAERSLQERLYGIFEGALANVSEEIRRLSGQRTESRDLGSLQAQFAITTAQARALDPKALERLPALSQAIEQATLGTARSRDELDRQRAQLEQSLSQTLTVVSNQIGQPAGADDIVAELKASRDLYERGVEENQVHAQALIKAINKFTGIVGRWDIDGMPDVREIA